MLPASFHEMDTNHTQHAGSYDNECWLFYVCPCWDLYGKHDVWPAYEYSYGQQLLLIFAYRLMKCTGSNVCTLDKQRQLRSLQ